MRVVKLTRHQPGEIVNLHEPWIPGDTGV